MVLFATGLVQSAIESQAEMREGVEPPPGGRPVAVGLMALASGVLLWSISAQGHASQAPAATFSVAADAVHLAAAAVWITGLVMTLLILRGAPRVAPEAGPQVAGRVLARFSQVALVAVAITLATGTLRTVAELADPAELWETAHGRSIVIKLALLAPIGFLAFRNRKIVTALAYVEQPNAPTLAMVRRGVAVEMTIALVVVLVAALLVAQIPGRLE